jgi:hypothetical protein
VCDDDVIEQWNTDDRTGFGDTAREFEVFAARSGIAARVVMNQHEPAGGSTKREP